MPVQIAPYGSWPSPVTAETFTARSVTISQVRIDQADVYWVEGQPQREGRNVLLSMGQLGQTREVLPLIDGERLAHVATRVHEYGGRAYAVKNGQIVFSDGADDRVYFFNANDPKRRLLVLTPFHDCRYGDFELDLDRNLVFAVCEDHRVERDSAERDAAGEDSEPRNTLVAIPLDGSAARDETLIRPVFAQADFAAAPTLSPDGTKLAWLTWNHPHMPWTKSTLHVGSVQPDGALGDQMVLVDKPGVSVYEPRWTLDGDLIHVDDSTGWANLYRTEGFNQRANEPEDAWIRRLRTRALHPTPHAFSQPHWRLGLHSYDNLDHNHLVCAWIDNGIHYLGTIRLDNGLSDTLKFGWSPCGNVAASDQQVVFLGDNSDSSPCIVRFAHGKSRVLRASTEVKIDPEMVSVAQSVSWPTRDGAVAYGFFYPPTNSEYVGEGGSLPPLIVSAHSGPTHAFRAGFSPDTQFWTTRGFAVLEVNYRGSTGFGRAYRSALVGNWGTMDAFDCIDGALWAIKTGLVDPQRIAIRGQSAGGFTALNALARSDVFSAGTSICGVSDLRTFQEATHKFESHYASLMLGTDDPDSPLWQERSPIHLLDQIQAPLLLLGGTDDQIVPSQQTEQTFQLLQQMGKPVALELFAGEGHSFVRPESIRRVWNSELAFYGKVWGIEVKPATSISISNF